MRFKSHTFKFALFAFFFYTVLLYHLQARNYTSHVNSQQQIAMKIGGKASNLAFLQRYKEANVPYWNMLPTVHFDFYIQANNIQQLIDKLQTVCNQSPSDIQAIDKLADTIRKKIRTGRIPNRTRRELHTLLTDPKLKNKSLAIRSSAVGEDGVNASCAGLYNSIIGVKERMQIHQAIKDVWSSTFSTRAVLERIRHNLLQNDAKMAIVIQELISSKASGVVSTRVLGNNYAGIEISSTYGYGQGVVSGEVENDHWILHSDKKYIIEQSIPKKQFGWFYCGNKYGLQKKQINQRLASQPSLDKHTIDAIVQITQKIQAHYGCDIDMEFVVGDDNKLYILQARPLIKIQESSLRVVDTSKNNCIAVAKGQFSVPGVTSGRLVFIPSISDLAKGKIKLTPNDIALVYVSTNVWSQYLTNIKGIISREGSASSHPILLSREKGIPCVIGIKNNFDQLIKLSGQTVTIDGLMHTVFLGKPSTKAVTTELEESIFAPPVLKEWPKIKDALPHLIHNKMVVKNKGRFYRLTPTYPLEGFQMDVNMMRSKIIPQVLKSPKVNIQSICTKTHVGTLMTPFKEYVGLFKGYSYDECVTFNKQFIGSIKEFETAARSFKPNKASYQNYFRAYAKFRSFIWLSDAMRTYARRQADIYARRIDLPAYYLEEIANAIQSSIPERDTDMLIDLYSLKQKYCKNEVCLTFPNAVEQHPGLIRDIRKLKTKYRFNHDLSFRAEVKDESIWERVMHTNSFSSQKKRKSNFDYIPSHPLLQSWLKVSIHNRILQSDAHHVDAAARETVRPVFLKIGASLTKQKVIKKPEDVFSLSSKQLLQLLSK